MALFFLLLSVLIIMNHVHIFKFHIQWSKEDILGSEYSPKIFKVFKMFCLWWIVLRQKILIMLFESTLEKHSE